MAQTAKTWKEFAIETTLNAAQTKDWRLSTNRMRALRQIAREWQDGYIIATPSEMHNMYPNEFQYNEISADNNIKMLWAIEANLTSIRRAGKRLFNIEFCPICKADKIDNQI